ncbi:ATP-dependent Clp protease ATP-binding subunit [Companilactobacillus kedongensis]|uniref:ATP-dependent Clp protease ATP-binding subunit n=1 Tax=Companilactobacillus kedongensis TaxID=2486004 RepID=UPI000F777C6E|nr:ATP-dependent Clp protease ATP-binding subunit [Companilactobacillus kedongensis]
MDKVFTESAKNALVLAQEQAKTFHHNAVGTEHILLGLTMENDGIAGITLRDLAVSERDVEEEIEHLTGYGDVSSNTAKGIYLPYSPKGQKILSNSQDVSDQYNTSRIGTEHILLAILDDTDNLANRILTNLGLSLTKTKNLLLNKMGMSTKSGPRGMAANIANANRKKKQPAGTPTLDSLARDLTKIAADNQIDPVIGRKKEVERTIQILSRRTKNNPVLVGEPGVGKTAIAEGLASYIVKKEVPLDMQNKRIMMLDMGSLVAGTKYRGEFEDRLKKIIEEIYKDKHVILFIDELHTLIGAGGAEGAIDASNILKPALARGELQLIGATTLNEYQKYIEKDSALERRFAKIVVEEPTEDESVEILKGLRPRYEQHHGLIISDEAIEAAVKLSTRYLTNRFLPDKAIDLVDEASAKVRIHNVSKHNDLDDLTSRSMKLIDDKNNAILDQDFEKAAKIREKEQDLQEKIAELKEAKETGHAKQPVVKVSDIAEIIAEWTGVPVKQITRKESERLLNLEKELHKRVIGQNDAISAISRAIRRARSGMKDPDRPIGSFMFLGPTGVGKTELAKSIAEVMFGSEDNLIRVDMSEYMEQYSTSKLIGSAPGYVGFDDGGQLTEKVRNEPYSVILLDEVEKAHPDVFNILLQVLDDGILTDAKGRKVDFRNTIIIMTSNLGARALQEDKSVGFGAKDVQDDYKEMQNRINTELKKFFRPEFLNRIDETIVFKSLDRDQLKAIAKIMSGNLRKRLEDRKIELVISPAAYSDLVKDGYNPEYGARPMRRTIQREIEDPVSELLLMNKVGEGDTIKVGSKQGKLTVTVSEEKKQKNEKSLTH